MNQAPPFWTALIQTAWEVPKRMDTIIRPGPITTPSSAAFAREREVAEQIKNWFGGGSSSFLNTIAKPENLSEWLLHRVVTSLEAPTTKAFPEEIRGLPTEFHARLIHDKDLQADERRALMDEITSLKNGYAFYELLVKALVNRELPEGLYIPVPKSFSNTPLYYRVAKTFISGGGLVAYGLLPATRLAWKKLDPIILFRGSLFYPAGLDALSSYVTDMESWLGYSGYQSGKESMSQFMESLPPERPVIVTGHSLGAAQAQWFTIDHASQVKELVTFNAPGLPLQEVQDFNQKIRDKVLPLKITLFRTQGDFIDLVGDCHLGFGGPPFTSITLKTFKPEEGISYHPHQSRFLGRDAESYSIEKIAGKDLQPLLDNRVRSNLEGLRKNLGGTVAAPVLWTIRAIARPLLGTRAKNGS